MTVSNSDGAVSDNLFIVLLFLVTCAWIVALFGTATAFRANLVGGGALIVISTVSMLVG